MLDSIPLVAKITVWICIAHLWIIICTLVYVKTEGLPKTHNKNTTYPVSESELISRILSNLKLDFSDLKKQPTRKLEFQEEYERRWKVNKRLSIRKQFSDVSKTYVFVLLSHAGIGKLFISTY